MTKFLSSGAVSVGRTVSCPLPSRHPLVELLCSDGGDFVNVRDPILHISLPEPLLGRRHLAVDRALFRKYNERVYGLNFLGVSRLLGIWTSTPLLPRDGLHASTHFAGRGSSFEAPRWQGLRLFGFVLGIVGRPGCACTVQKIPCLSLPT